MLIMVCASACILATAAAAVADGSSAEPVATQPAAGGGPYGVARYAGKVVFTEGGKPVVLPSYCSCGAGWGQAWKDAHQRFVAHGRKVFWLSCMGGYNGEWGTTPFWTAPGQINDKPVAMPKGYMGLDEQAKAILAMEPQARFFVRMMDAPPATWFKANPDDTMVNCEGKRYDAASLASDKYLDELGRFLRALTRWCGKAEWGGRVIGYVIYPLGEGCTNLSLEGYLFDQSPAMERAYRAFLREKYQTDAALRAAWHDQGVTIDTARVPRDEDFRRRGAIGVATAAAGAAASTPPPPVLYWPPASQVQPERDYFDLQARLFRRYMRTMVAALHQEAGAGKLCGIDALKGNMAGWMCVPTFSGQQWKEHFGDWMLATGTTGMAEMIDWPEVDLVATPHDYRQRWVGFGFDPEGVGDSVQLHGKVMLVEEDQRSYANDERGLFGSLEPGQEPAVLLRNAAASASKAHQAYPMDVCVGYFESEAIQKVLQRRAAMEAELLARPRADVPCVVMLADDRAGYYTDFSSQYHDLAVIRQRIVGMNHCGVPTRTFLFDDLGRADFPTCHKLFLLPNCYRYTPELAALLREKLFRDGNVIVFGPGSGITDGQTVSPDFAARLMGMSFELYDYEYPRFVTIDNWTHPAARGFGACDTYGDTHRYGPVLVPVDPAGPPCKGGVKPRVSGPLSGDLARSVPVRASGESPHGDTTNGGERLTVIDAEPGRSASLQTAAAGEGGLTVLGSIALDNGKRRPGLVVKEFGRGTAGNGRPGPRGPGDYAVVFTAAVPVPARLLRNLASFSGTHVYDDADDVVYADSSMVAVHAVMPGPRTIRLPGRFTVTDAVTGQRVGEALTQIDVQVGGGAVTRWFLLDASAGK